MQGWIKPSKVRIDETLKRSVGGVMKKHFAMLTNDEGQEVFVMVKTDWAECVYAEVTVSRMIERLNVVPVQQVAMTHLNGRVASVHVWEDNFRLADGYPHEKMKTNLDQKVQDAAVTELLDGLFRNFDRHDRNYGFLNDRLFLIDHGHARPWLERDLLMNPQILNFIPGDILNRIINMDLFDLLDYAFDGIKDEYGYRGMIYEQVNRRIEQFVNRTYEYKGDFLDWWEGPIYERLALSPVCDEYLPDKYRKIRRPVYTDYSVLDVEEEERSHPGTFTKANNEVTPKWWTVPRAIKGCPCWYCRAWRIRHPFSAER